MINKTKRKATVERCGSMVVIRMIGGPDCLWLNMYLDTDTWSMTCDSDIGFYAYHWGRCSSSSETFLPFCLRWLADGDWLLRTCIGERHVDKGWDYEKTRQALLNAYKEENTDEDEPDVDTYYIEEALSMAAQFDDVDAFAAVLQAEADSLALICRRNGGTALPASTRHGRSDSLKFVRRSLYQRLGDRRMTMRLIDANALVAVPNVCKVTEYDETGCGMSYNAVPVKAIYDAPTIEAEPVRHGEWVAVEFMDPHGFMLERMYKCSLCHEFVTTKNRNFCPNCGAKMDLKGD